tara:strand:+ start:342 stop:1070 length:729 start_codon:yes stop_codon:yes gene_type:complete
MLGLYSQLVSSVSHQAPTKDAYYVNHDGTDDYMELGVNYAEDGPEVFIYNKDFSLAAWIYVNSTTGSNYMFSTGNVSTRFSWLIVGGGVLRWSLDGATSNTSTTISSGAWTHLAVTRNYDAGEVKHYINGSLDDTDSVVTGASRTVEGADAVIGTQAWSKGDNEFNGRIGSLAIFNETLTAGQITNLAGNSGYNAATLGGCVGWWRMGDGTGDSGSTVVDSSVNSNNASLINNAAITSGTVG